MSWERAVEEVLLREVIMRFRKGVETQRLAGVVVEDDDYAQVNAGMTKCSNYAHDKALLGGVAFRQLILMCQKWPHKVWQSPSPICCHAGNADSF